MKFKDITANKYVKLNQEWNLSNGDHLIAQVIIETCKTDSY